jgi:hypothetical protein
MWRLAFLAIMICFVFAGAVRASIAIGNNQPPSAAIRRFHLDNCAQPCAMGVTVGQTTYSDALAMFQGRGNGPDGLAFDAVDADKIALQMRDPEGKEFVNEITFWFDEGRAASVTIESYYDNSADTVPTLIDVVMRYGIPRCAEASPAMGTAYEDIYIVNPQLGIQVAIHGLYQIQWESPITTFAIFRYIPGKDTDPCVCKDRWAGPHQVISTGAWRPCTDDAS